MNDISEHLKLKVWVLNPFDDIPGEGKPQRFWSLAEALSSRGHKVVWWSSKYSHRRKIERSIKDKDLELMSFDLRLVECAPYQRNVTLARIKNHREWGRNLVSRALNEVEQGVLPAPDVIIASMPPLEGPMAALELKAHFGCKVITDLMDAWPKTLLQVMPFGWAGRILGSLALYPYSRMLKRAMKESDVVTAQSETFVRYAEANGWIGQSLVAYLGAEKPNRAIEIKRRKTCKFVYIGAMGRSYDLENLVRVARILENEKFRFELHIAGEGEKLDALKAMAKESSMIHFHGFLQESDLMNLLNDSDVGIVPMYPESGVAVPYKAGEYLASGLPLINSLNGEMLRLIEEYDCGLNYEAGNPDSLLFVMRTLLEAEIDSLESMKKNALRLYSDKFDRNEINSSLTRFIEQL